MKKVHSEFSDYLAEGPAIFDGAMGTNLQSQNLSPDDFGGKLNCNEALNLFCPSAPRRVHTDFLMAGCRIIETNTFGANRLALREYALENDVAKINIAAVKIAREAIEASNMAGRSFIAGSIGPASLLPSLGHIKFDEMSSAYREQIEALIDGGVDILWIETCQDLLQIKAALRAAMTLFREKMIRLPVGVSVTVDPSGKMLAGTDIDAVVAALEPVEIVNSIGINCATGPLEMVRHVKRLAENCSKPVSVMPNAGLPEIVDGQAVYRLDPDELASFIHRFVTEDGVEIVGGCCGTTPDHIRAISKKICGIRPRRRSVRSVPAVTSLYNSVSLIQSPPPAMVGERTNATGAKRFRDLLLKDDWDGIVSMAINHARGGAHILDVSTAFPGRNEGKDMTAVISRFARQIDIPLMIDSTDSGVVLSSLKLHGGRCIINSVNLEDGGAKLRNLAGIASEFGAELVCLTIDEKGMAHTLDAKMEIVSRIYKILTSEFSFRDSDLIFDPLTFTIGSGDPSLRRAAVETLDAISAIKKRYPSCLTVLGISNISYGLIPAAREVLNSVFLAEAVKRGLDMAIVNPAGIMPLYKISQELQTLALNFISDISKDGNDLKAFIRAFDSPKVISNQIRTEKVHAGPEERLKAKIIDGDKSGLKDLIDELIPALTPKKIINDILIAGMKQVGELFGAGRLQLPFVLQSAETVQSAVEILKTMITENTTDSDISRSEKRPKVILATVSGDVHDIGKNLVGIILANNGYEIVDLGIKIDIDTMIKALEREQAEIIGMSGLLVRSTQIMKENIEELNRRNLSPRVILGGAALTREFVESQIKSAYRGDVFYAQDAFEALRIIEKLIPELNR